MFLVGSASMLSDENFKALGGIIQRYALTGKIGPVAIVAESDEAFRQAQVFASAASAERPVKIFRQQQEAARWLINVIEVGGPTDDAHSEPGVSREKRQYD